MIHWQVISKVMSTTEPKRGILFHALRARNVELSDQQLVDMINNASVRMTPQVGKLIHSNLEIQLNLGNIYHYVFLYSGRDGALIRASRARGGTWEECCIIQPQRKAG